MLLFFLFAVRRTRAAERTSLASLKAFGIRLLIVPVGCFNGIGYPFGDPLKDALRRPIPAKESLPIDCWLTDVRITRLADTGMFIDGMGRGPPSMVALG